MRVVDRYLLREVLWTAMAVTAILLLTTLGLLFADTLADVARGTVPLRLLFTQLGLRAFEALTVLLPLSVFLSVLLSFGRLYRDSEMAVLAACGVSRVNLYRPLVFLLLPGFLGLSILSLWGAPWALRTSKELIDAAAKDMSVAALKAGQFHEIARDGGVVYVETLSPDGQHFSNAFIHFEREGRKDVITAKSGYQYQDVTTGAHYLALLDGFRSEGVPGQGDYRFMHFRRNDIRLPDPELKRSQPKHNARPLRELWEQAGRAELSELHWRLAPPFALLTLALLALPLAKTAPRQSYYGNLVVAISIYVIYANLLAIGRAWLDDGRIPIAAGLWWVHASSLICTAWLLRNRRRPVRRLRVAT